MSVVLIGQRGSGKTTLFNRMTNSNLSTKPGEEQVTMNVTQKRSAYGTCQFNLFDSPPFGFCKNQIQNAAGLIIALTEGPVNRIIITYKFQRTDLILASFNYYLQFVQNYIHLLTIAVTHMDINANDEDYIQNQMKQAFAKQNCGSIIFTSINDSGNDLCEKVLKEMVNKKAEQIYFNPQRILYIFDFEELEKNLESKFNEQLQILEAGSRRQFKNLKGEITSSESSTQFLQQLIDQAQQYLEMFELTNQNFIMGLQKQERFIFHKKIKIGLENQIKFTFFAKKKQSYFSFFYQDYLKLQEQENIECSIQNKKWETELFECYELCLEKLLDQIAQQKKRIVRL